MYGPTEATIWSSVYKVDRELTQVAAIGRPIGNTTMYVLDAHHQPVPIGVSGDLYIGGDGLARGYRNRPELTSERFLTDPFRPGERIYRTGDLALFLPDGNIQFQGRADFQVKLRGFRIELGEIEAVLAKHPAVERAVVAVREDRPGDKRLIGYVVTKSGQDPSSAELRGHLEQSLPDYMIPGFFMKIESLPLTPNGKINRLGLPVPEWPRGDAEGQPAPSNPFELIMLRIWERVLGVPNLSVDDDFFDLGGHSLLAVRLMAEIEKVVGRKIPLASLFRGSTVASLAKLIQENAESDPEPLVAELQAGTNGAPPLFAVAAPGVKTLGYALLGRHLGSDHAVYKIQGQAPVAEGRPYELEELRLLGREYAAAMRAVQPQGPYFIVGMCDGCHIAEQMILQLEAQGLRVGTFAVLDAWVMQNVRRRLQSRVLIYEDRLRKILRMSLREQFMSLINAVKNHAQIWAGRPNPWTAWDNAYWPESFTASRFRAPVVLFKRPKQPYCYIDDPQMGWGSRTEGGVEIHEINADHFAMLREPNVQIVGEVLGAHLRPAVSHVETPPADLTAPVAPPLPASL
jgi:thioesterase domain-containing protein/acyl carrier protein